MKLRTKKSHINTLPEGQAPQRILPRLVKFLYYLLLLAIVGGILWVLAMRYVYFSGRGQVMVEKVNISSNWNGTIRHLHKKKGDEFLPGNLLATLELNQKCVEKEPKESDIRLTRLAYDIELKQAEHDTLVEQLENYAGDDGEREILHRALEIGDADSRRRNEKLRDEAEKLSRKISLLAAEIEVKKEEFSVLQHQLNQKPTQLCDDEQLIATTAGRIENVLLKEGEFIHQGENLFLALPADSQVFVEAYFDRVYLRHIAQGDSMRISFPDKYKSIGEVVSFSAAAKPFPERLWKEYVPVESKIRVLLRPVEKDGMSWRVYDRLDVKIRGRRK